VIVDLADFSEHHNRLDLLHRLRDTHPDFRCTLFAIPGLGSEDFWASVPEWCELAMHGWKHPDSREAEHWSYLDTITVLSNRPYGFVRGFKAPGWQISDDTYRAIQDLGWWVADHWDNDHRRPIGIDTFVISEAAGGGIDSNHWHGHIGNVCGNGIEETFDVLQARVAAAETFELVSEVVAPW